MKTVDLSVFNVDERIVINSTVANETMSGYGRSDLLANLNFAKSISTDPDVVELLDGLLDKVKAMSDAEWEEMKLLLPMEVAYDAESNVDVVPDDENVI